MRVVWNNLAEQQLDPIAFVSAVWGKTIGHRLLRESRHISRLLARHPHLGHAEPLLADRPKGYRSIFVPPYNKLVYYIEGSEVRIAAVWDTRRDPTTLAAEVS